MTLIERVAARILTRVEVDNVSLKGAIEDFFNEKPELKSLRDVILALTTSTLRKYIRVDEIAKNVLGIDVSKIQPYKRNILRIVLYEVKYRRFITTSRAMRVLRKSGLNINLQDLEKVRSVDVHDIIKGRSLKERISIKYSFPKWIIEKLSKKWPLNFIEKILDKMNEVPTLWVRINTLKVRLDRAYRILEGYGIEYTVDEEIPELVRVKQLGKILRSKEYLEGYFYPQDKASCIAIHELSPKPGEIIADLCSAPGGKASYIAQLTGNKCRIIALDISLRRLMQEKTLLSRLGVKNYTLLYADSRRVKFNVKFDKVLVDPDCTAIGIMGHSPELRLKIKERDVRKLSLIQRQLLLKAIDIVKRGGIILYTTCTLTNEENEENIKYIIENKPNIKLEEVEHGVASPILPPTKYLLPNIHNTIGFFIAKLIKA